MIPNRSRVGIITAGPSEGEKGRESEQHVDEIRFRDANISLAALVPCLLMPVDPSPGCVVCQYVLGED